VRSGGRSPRGRPVVAGPGARAASDPIKDRMRKIGDDGGAAGSPPHGAEERHGPAAVGRRRAGDGSGRGAGAEAAREGPQQHAVSQPMPHAQA
jgi:hypothetical protein